MPGGCEYRLLLFLVRHPLKIEKAGNLLVAWVAAELNHPPHWRNYTIFIMPWAQIREISGRSGILGPLSGAY